MMGSIVFGAMVCPDGLDDELCWVTFEGGEGMGSIVFGATGGTDGVDDELLWVLFEGGEGMGDGVHRFDDRIGVDWRYGGGGALS